MCKLANTEQKKIKNFNALIDNKPFFDQPVKKQESYEKLIEMSRNDDYTTGHLDYLYHQNFYQFIGNDLSRQTNTSIPQKINFTGKLDKDDGLETMFLNFSLNSLIVAE